MTVLNEYLDSTICITCMRIITTWTLNLPHHDDDVSLLD